MTQDVAFIHILTMYCFHSLPLSLCFFCLLQLMTQLQKSNLFLAYFRSLIEEECSIEVELKNGVLVNGKLTFIDNNMCMMVKVDEHQLAKLPPQFAGLSSGLYIRGSAIRAVYLPKLSTQLDILQSECQKS